MAVARRIEADPNLSRLLDELEPGGEVVITHRGHAVGRLVKPGSGMSDRRIETVEQELCELAAQANLGPVDRNEIRSWRDEGRR